MSAINGRELKRKKNQWHATLLSKDFNEECQHTNLIETVRNDLNLMRFVAVVFTTQKCRFLQLNNKVVF